MIEIRFSINSVFVGPCLRYKSKKKKSINHGNGKGGAKNETTFEKKMFALF